MKLIIGQGNPGPEYEKTRHNVGFLVLDYYAKKHNLDFQPKTKFHALVAELNNGEDKILFVKPTTYYNETGQSVRALADFYKIESTDILAIHDDLALPFGTLRIREKGSDAGNNGIKSLNAHLGESYTRIRVGTRNDLVEKIGDHDFVLSRFSSDESEKLSNDLYPKIAELIDDFINSNHAVTSHRI